MKVNFNVLNKISNKKKLIVGIGLALIILIISASIFGFNKKAEEKQEIKNVKVQKVAVDSIATEVEYASKLNPVHEITVFPKNSGQVISLNVDIGDKVKAGQVLFSLDTAELQAQLQAQQAALQQQITSSEQAVNKSQIAYYDAKDNCDKMQKLYDAGVVSKQELSNAKLRYDNSSVDLKAAQDNLNHSTQAAAVTIAQIQLNNATITSPISGVISAKDVKVGQFANSQSGSVTIIDSSSFIAEVGVPDKIIGKIQIGQSVQVIINALDNKKISGAIDNISPNTNSKDNSYTVKVKIDNLNGELKAGMFARISLPAEKKDNILTVPNEAIKMENNVNYLYVDDNGKVKKVSVEVGICNDKITEITGNVKEGTYVITEGQNLLSSGDKINAVK